MLLFRSYILQGILKTFAFRTTTFIGCFPQSSIEGHLMSSSTCLFPEKVKKLYTGCCRLSQVFISKKALPLDEAMAPRVVIVGGWAETLLKPAK